MTLNCVKDFVNPWTDLDEGVKSIEAWKWRPATDSFADVLPAESKTPMPRNAYRECHKGVRFTIVTHETMRDSWTGEAEISYAAECQTITLLTVLSEAESHTAQLHANETDAIESARREAYGWIERELALAHAA